MTYYQNNTPAVLGSEVTMETPHANTVIRNGRVLDRSQNINRVADVYITNGRIASIGPPPATAWSSQFNSVDASGCVVCPGLVDCHVHAYEYATPLGVNIDETCLSKGVTAVVDAGSAGAADQILADLATKGAAQYVGSKHLLLSRPSDKDEKSYGSSTFPGLRKFIAERSKTRLYSFLHVAQHGLASAGCVRAGGGGECDSLNVVNVEDCVRVINENRDMIVGVKVRLAAAVCDNGKNEEEVFRRALQAASICQVPLMTHHALSSLGHGGKLGCPESLMAGDIYTHCFHNYNSLLDPKTGRVDSHCLEAKRRGVLFDVGHGQGSFSWAVAEQCAAEGFWPDIISTDLHRDSINGPAYDLPCVMTKMLHVGMPLEDVIAAVTSTPAAAIGKLGEIGQLRPGAVADVTVLRLEDVSESLEDSSGDLRTINKMIVPTAVFVGGQQHPISPHRSWPNAACAAECRARVANNKRPFFNK